MGGLMYLILRGYAGAGKSALAFRFAPGLFMANFDPDDERASAPLTFHCVLPDPNRVRLGKQAGA